MYMENNQLKIVEQFIEMLIAERGASANTSAAYFNDITNFEAFQNKAQTAEGIRLNCLLEIAYATGLRVTELVSLPNESFRYESETLLIYGKGGKERLVPLTPSAIKAIVAYEEIRGHFLKEHETSKFFFPSRSKQGHLTRRRLGQLLKELARKAGLDPAII